MEITFSELQRRRPLRCPYCHDLVELSEASACPECQTGMHPECLQELGRCPTSGCAGEVIELREDVCVWCFQRDGAREQADLPPVCAPCREQFHAKLIYLCRVLGCGGEVEGPDQLCGPCYEIGPIGRARKQHGLEIAVCVLVVVVAVLFKLLA